MLLRVIMSFLKKKNRFKKNQEEKRRKRIIIKFKFLFQTKKPKIVRPEKRFIQLFIISHSINFIFS